jgi:hypothetical protein
MTEQIYTHNSTGERFVLHRSGIPIEGLGFTLVEYAPADSPDDKKLMPLDKWQQEMRQPLYPLECHYCLGTSRDPKRPQKHCGYCFGSSFLNSQGDALTNDAATAEALLGVSKLIKQQAHQIEQLQRIADLPEVKELLINLQWSGVAKEENKWRNGSGHGPEGQRQTGD